MKEKVAIVGGGIVGIAHAWQEAKRGALVTLFERNKIACGASVRNFGMVWPVGQPNGPLHSIALRSRELWNELLEAAGLWGTPCGSLHVATREDELNVLAEFAENAARLDFDCKLLSPDQAAELSPALRASDLRGALWSPTEMGVDPREVILKAPLWLHKRYGTQLEYGVCITEVQQTNLVDASGKTWEFDRVTVAGGADLAILYPEVFKEMGIGACKLQMMRTVPQPNAWRLGPHIASGLTLRHYPSFRVCRSLDALKQRIESETPDLNRYGIHVMASQNRDGNVVLGDSHEYDAPWSPFNKEVIDDLILEELQRFLHLPEWKIAQRWHGVYTTLPDEVQFIHEPSPGVTIVLATGGAGMTMSFGLAEKTVGGSLELNEPASMTA